MSQLKTGDQYINSHGAINPTPMTLVEITETEYIFMDGTSPWGGSKSHIQELIKRGTLRKVESEE